MTIEGELRAVSAVGRRLREQPATEVLGRNLDASVRSLRRSVGYLRTEAEGRLPEVEPDTDYEGLSLREAVSLLVARAVAVSPARRDPDAEVLGLVEQFMGTSAARAAQAAEKGTGPASGSPTADGDGLGAHSGPATRKTAGLAVLPRTGTQRGRVLAAIAEVARMPQILGLTDPDVCARLRMEPNTERPRRKELVDGGWLVDSGQTRPHNGRAHVVWVLTPRAERELFGTGERPA